MRQIYLVRMLMQLENPTEGENFIMEKICLQLDGRKETGATCRWSTRIRLLFDPKMKIIDIPTEPLLNFEC